MKRYWERNENIIAERFGEDEISGVFRKKIIVGSSEKAFIEKDGSIIDEMGEGYHKIYLGYKGGKNKSIIFLDTKEKVIEKDVEGKTKDCKRVIVRIRIGIKPEYPTRLTKLLKEKKFIDTDVVWKIIKSDVVRFINKGLGMTETSNISEDFEEKMNIAFSIFIEEILKNLGISKTFSNLDFIFDKYIVEKVKKISDLMEFD